MSESQLMEGIKAAESSKGFPVEFGQEAHPAPGCSEGEQNPAGYDPAGYNTFENSQKKSHSEENGQDNLSRPEFIPAPQNTDQLTLSKLQADSQKSITETPAACGTPTLPTEGMSLPALSITGVANGSLNARDFAPKAPYK